MEKSLKKLNLACGLDYREGYINIDNQSMFPNTKVDLNADIFTLEMEAGTVDEILLSHFIMYTRPEELEPLLLKFNKWLKSEGQLIIETIDFKKVLQIALSKSNPDTVLYHGLINIFGTKTTGPHRWGWTPGDLLTILYKTGFLDISYKTGDKKPERDFKLIAKK